MTNNDLQQASAWTRNYRNQNPNGIKAHCLSAETLQGILSQKGCVGVRSYYGLDDAGQPQLVLVGYDANDHDMLPAAPTELQRMDAENLVEEAEPSVRVSINHVPCPPCCSSGNILNS
ncbi:hypothetical protein [Hymenobacter psychrophilus]|uniref:Uncharacterized protein n=1 Tax=Hymenobacter psychrophilus TaxID=651662 RepID=A0A1H3GWZ7_9BACT|nr:hypothetical protein [Hymenobacter psychrophilus]SDY07647.1 hypothetical protein SAMN04488069_105201 [Hymenobacter psychrophilus]